MKKFKVLFSMILLLVVLTLTIGCGSKNDIVGKWEATEVQEFDPGEPVTEVWEVKEDGSFIANFYSEDGTVSDFVIEGSYTYEDDVLSVDSNIGDLVFNITIGDGKITASSDMGTVIYEAK